MKWKGKGLLILLFLAVATSYVLFNGISVDSKELKDGTQVKFKSTGDQLEVYDKDNWSSMFVKGVNMGATLPGHFPGQLPMKKEDYLRWFSMIDEMGANTIRIYTIHNPVFYEALVEYNKNHQDDPLYFMQGVWSPVSLLKEKQDAFADGVTEAFKKEIDHAVGAVYGDITIPKQEGKASGEYTADASPYLLAWHIGTEWSPEVVENTNKKHSDDPAFQGAYFKAADNASPFESWLAVLINHTAKKDRERGWQHPMTFTNWMTTDPLNHPKEPQYKEDLVSVDPTHIEVKNWDAGYFASYHAYPYYPDFLRYTEKYNEVKNTNGKIDPYKGYLKELKNYHKQMPVMITEYGVPSSRGNAHFGALGRDQGDLSEKEQGKHNVDMLNHIHKEGYAGAVLFNWQDEWFKKTWNEMPFVVEGRRPYWFNVLSAETSYGVLGMYPEKSRDMNIDGQLSDWNDLNTKEVEKVSTSLTDIRLTHDEGYVYVSAHLPEGFDLNKHSFYLGADTLEGGTKTSKNMKGVELDEGLETIVRLSEEKRSEVLISSNYDFHQRFYENAGGSKKEEQFNSWKLAVSLPMRLPGTNKALPFENAEVGKMKRATSSKDSQADWQIKGDVLEVKIPWALLGFSDPSTRQVVSYGPRKDKESLPFEVTEGIRFIPWIVHEQTNKVKGFEGLSSSVDVSEIPRYKWEKWQNVNYVEKKKKSYYMMQEAFQNINK